MHLKWMWEGTNAFQCDNGNTSSSHYLFGRKNPESYIRLMCFCLGCKSLVTPMGRWPQIHPPGTALGSRISYKKVIRNILLRRTPQLWCHLDPTAKGRCLIHIKGTLASKGSRKQHRVQNHEHLRANEQPGKDAHLGAGDLAGNDCIATQWERDNGRGALIRYGELLHFSVGLFFLFANVFHPDF